MDWFPYDGGDISFQRSTPFRRDAAGPSSGRCSRTENGAYKFRVGQIEGWDRDYDAAKRLAENAVVNN